jgi:hypothetical protein
MTGIEAIPKITTLLTQLIDRVKDRNTAEIVSQIQSLFQTLQGDYFVAEQKATESGRQLFTNEREHAKQVADFEARIKQLQSDHSELEAKHSIEITKLTERHAAEIAQFQKASSGQSRNTIGTPPGF